MDWSKKQTLELIELIHIHECLWNVKNEEYRDRQKRKDSVEAIARQMEIDSPSDVEKKITNLKNQYNREVNKMKTKSGCGTDEVYTSSWYGFKPLSFLKNNNLPRKSRSTVSTTEEENYDEGVNYSDLIILEQNMPSTSGAPEISASNEAMNHSAKRSKLDQEAEAFTILNEEMNHSAKRSKLDQEAEAFTILKEVRENINNRKIKDEFDVFGEYVASELRGITGKINILETKKQIQDLIYYKKLEQINLSATTATQNIHEDDPRVVAIYSPMTSPNLIKLE